jgi:tetratricopeptide (TPR) repeat protein
MIRLRNLGASTVDNAMLIEELSDAALRAISSPKILERGATYALSGAVRIVGEDLKPVPTISAEVDGTGTYSTRVWIDGRVHGTCDCPNADDGWFCKHQVAVALVWRKRLGGSEPVVDEAARKRVQASVKRAETIKRRREALQEFLTSLPASVLAGKLMDFADSYREIDRELRTWQRISGAQARPDDRKALVSETLAAGRHFMDSWDVGPWVRQAQSILPLLQNERARDPQAAVALSLYALRRGWAALMRADDSNGEIGGLCAAIGAEWIAALQAAGPQPAAFGDTYLRVQLEDPFGSFDTVAAESAMGSDAVDRYRQALERHWRELKDAALGRRTALEPGRRTASERLEDGGTRLWTVERLHLEQLELAGDIDGMLAVLREDLSEPHHHAAITALLEKHGRFREAFANAEKACKAIPGDRRLEDDLLRCYERDGWTDEAYTLRRKRFEEAPSVQGFHATLKAASAAGKNEADVRGELLAWLEARELEAMRHTERPRSRFVGGSHGADPPRRDVSLRAALLGSEQRWAEACKLVQPPAVCDPRVLREIALHLPDAERDRAAELLLRVLGRAMLAAQTPYRDELALVSEIAARLDADRRSTWLASLRSEFKAKRNFVRDLPKS